MTLVSSIITSAFRETNLIPVGQAPTTNQINEALDLLNTIILSSLGNEIGDELRDLNIGGSYDETNYTFDWVPYNARLVLQLSAPSTLYLNPEPYTGQRLAFVDATGNIATNPLTINGNGRKIEGSSSIILNVNSDSRQWLYRGDIATWAKLTSLVTSDQMPFPQDFDDYFITSLAMRINPRFSQAVSNETLETLKRARRNIRSCYRNKAETYPEYIGVIGQNRNMLPYARKFGHNYFWWSN